GARLGESPAQEPPHPEDHRLALRNGLGEGLVDLREREVQGSSPIERRGTRQGAGKPALPQLRGSASAKLRSDATASRERRHGETITRSAPAAARASSSVAPGVAARTVIEKGSSARPAAFRSARSRASWGASDAG